MNALFQYRHHHCHRYIYYNINTITIICIHQFDFSDVALTLSYFLSSVVHSGADCGRCHGRLTVLLLQESAINHSLAAVSKPAYIHCLTFNR